jgi:hypothetical protein
MKDVDHAMLAHWWRKSSAYWCKHPNISIVKRMKSFSWCWSWYDKVFGWVLILVATPQEEVTLETRSTWIGLTIITSTKVQKPSIVSIISTYCYDDYRNDIGKTCVCLCKTWNSTSLPTKAIFFWNASCLVVHSTLQAHQSRFILVGSMAWLHMHWKKTMNYGMGEA